MSRKKKIMLILGIVLILIAIGIFITWRVAFSRSCNPPLPREAVTIGNTNFSAEIASTMVEQSCGLSGRPGLADGDGMIFNFGAPSIQSFWMKDMNFAIDIIWIGPSSASSTASQKEVIGFAQNAPAPAPGTQIWELPIFNSPDGVDTVLEVPAGTVAKDNIKVGDAVIIKE